MSRRCCCVLDCAVYSDNWYLCPDVPDADHWDPVEGTWAITKPGGECIDQYMTGTEAGAMLICKDPTTDYPQYVYVSVGDVTGSRPRILLGVDYDPVTSEVGGYYYLEFDPDNQLMTWGVGTAADGGGFDETVLRQISEDYNKVLSGWLSMGDGTTITFSGGWSGDCHNTGWVCTTKAAGKYSGLMNGPAATAGAQFLGDAEYFVLLHHDDTPLTPDCGHCDCQCDEFCVPRTLSYTLTLLDGSSPCCVGDVGTLEFDDNNPIINYCTWPSATIEIGCGYSLQLRLNRPYDVGRWVECELWFMEDTGWPGSTLGSGSFPADCTCDPFYMRWDISVTYPCAEPPCDACGFRLEVFSS